MTNAALRGKPDAGNPHVAPSQCYGGTGRFDGGEVASAATPRRGSLLYKNRAWWITCALLLLLAPAAAGAPYKICVRPGTMELEEAIGDLRRCIEAHGANPPDKDFVIELEDGLYQLSAPLILSERESGTATASVVIRARNRGRAIVTGAVSLGPGRPVKDPLILSLLKPEVRSRVLEFDVPGTALPPGFRGGGCIDRKELSENPVQLFQCGRRLPCARWPKQSQTYTGDPLGPVIKSAKTCCGRMYDGGVFRYRSSRLAEWAREPDLWADGQWFYEWSNVVAPVVNIDIASESITVDMVQNRFGLKYGAGFHVLNAISEITEPGDWAIDRKARRILLLPLCDVVEAPVMMPVAKTILRAEKWRNGIVEGIVFEESCGVAVELVETEDVALVGSCIRHVGDVGIRIERGVRTYVDGCDLFDIGHGGISLNGGDRLSLRHGGCTVQNCHIQQFGIIQKTYTPGVSVEGCGNSVVRNLIHHGAHQAITFGGNDHFIASNVIHDVCRNNDAGSIYCCMRDVTQRGNVIEGNIIHMSGKQPRCSGTNGIYIDDYTSGTIIRGNIVNRASVGIYVGGGSQNLVEKNILVNTPVAFQLGTRHRMSWAKNLWVKDGTNGVLHVAFLRHADVYTNAEWRAHYPDMMKVFSFPDPTATYTAMFNVVRDNLAVGTEQGVVLDNAEAARLCNTLTNNVLCATDPGFVDYNAFGWELRDDSPYKKLVGGFDMECIGLYQSCRRFSPALRFGVDVTPPRPIGPEKVLAELNVSISKDGADWHRDAKQVNFKDYLGCEPPDGSEGHALVAYYGPANREDEDWRTYEFSFVPCFDGNVRLAVTGGKGEQTDVREVDVYGAKVACATNCPATVGGGRNMVFSLEVQRGMRAGARIQARASHVPSNGFGR